MKRRVAWILLMVGLGVLCVAPTAFARSVHDTITTTTDTTTTDTTTTTQTAGTPEIDVGAAAGALTLVGGALALLGERLRRT